MVKKILPNFFIVGAAKSGTTALYYYLKQHPEIFMSPFKEPHYFSEIDVNEKRKNKYIYRWDDYLALFKNVKNETAIGEGSVSYLCYEQAPENIKRAIPDAKIFIILRDPAERAFSHFLMDIRDGKLPPDSDFIATIKRDYFTDREKGWGHTHLFVECGMYLNQVKRYLELFGPKNVYIAFFDDLKADTTALVKNIFKFLDVDSNFSPNFKVKTNAFAKPRNKLLQSVYANPSLKKIGRKLVPDSLKEDLVYIFLKKAPKPLLKKEERRFLIEIVG
jgi:hypothetical protein